jgi:TRAP-type C4-dicarboxylate transport system permease small subunit
VLEGPAKILRKVSGALVLIGGAAILACSVLVMADVALRNLFGLSVLYSFELTSYAFGIAVALGLAEGVHAKSHIRIDVLYRRLALPVRSVLDCLALLLLAILATGLAYMAVGVAADSWSLGSRSTTTLSVPLVVPQGLWALGLVFFAATTAVLALRSFMLAVRARWSAVEPIAGI